MRESLKTQGYDWAKVAEDYPHDTITWQPISEKAVDSIELIELIELIEHI